MASTVTVLADKHLKIAGRIYIRKAVHLRTPARSYSDALLPFVAVRGSLRTGHSLPRFPILFSFFSQRTDLCRQRLGGLLARSESHARTTTGGVPAGPSGTTGPRAAAHVAKGQLAGLAGPRRPRTARV